MNTNSAVYQHYLIIFVYTGKSVAWLLKPAPISPQFRRRFHSILMYLHCLVLLPTPS